MVTVKQLRDLLSTMPDDHEVVIYPKYSSDKVNGFRKHRFKLPNVCLQEPSAIRFKDDPEKLKEYFGGRKYEEYEVSKHVAIIF
jgi:hypothetical protein